LRTSGATPLHLDRVADQAQGGLAEQDLARLGGLLQPGGHVDGVAGGVGLAEPGAAVHHLAGVDAGARVQAHAEVAVQLGLQVAQGVAQLDRGAHRPHGVVLVGDRDAEHGHAAVALQRADGAAVAPQYPLGSLVEAAHHAVEDLGVEPLADLRRPGQVAEDHGGGLAGLPCDPQRAAAGGAEVRVLAGAAAAVGALPRQGAHSSPDLLCARRPTRPCRVETRRCSGRSAVPVKPATTGEARPAAATSLARPAAGPHGDSDANR